MRKLKFVDFNKAMILLGVKIVHLFMVIYLRSRPIVNARFCFQKMITLSFLSSLFGKKVKK